MPDLTIPYIKLSPQEQRLVDAALEASKHAYCPHSNFHVGAAILTANDKIFSGCNIENASYGVSICAERTAAVKAVSEGHKSFNTVAVCCADKLGGWPCGACRQFLSEFGLNATVLCIVDENKSVQRKLLSELLPNSFGPHLPTEEEAQVLNLEEANNPSGTEQMPGAAELLAALPEDYWAIVTSGGHAATLSKLKQAGLAPPKTLVSADNVSIGKPDPEGYLKAAELLDRDPIDCVVIEDPPAGLEAANRAGMRSIGVLSTHEPSELTSATFIVKQLRHIRCGELMNGKITLSLDNI